MAKRKNETREFPPEQAHQVYERCYKRMVALLMTKFHFDQSTAQDVSSIAIVEALYNANSAYDPKKEMQPCAWLLNRALLRAKDHLRKRRKEVSWDHIAEPSYTMDHSDGPRRKLIQSLPTDLRELFDLLVAFRTPRDVAAFLQVDVKDIRLQQQRLRRAIQNAARELGYTRKDLFSF
jgi:DNA-directed RNA polymerase specialized sigma24 family protein